MFNISNLSFWPKSRIVLFLIYFLYLMFASPYKITVFLFIVPFPPYLSYTLYRRSDNPRQNYLGQIPAPWLNVDFGKSHALFQKRPTLNRGWRGRSEVWFSMWFCPNNFGEDCLTACTKYTECIRWLKGSVYEWQVTF